ncbi:MAG TPA: HAD family phosphatase [Thermomicrobiaceae bacterium]|nr:HAD family phosphatase [Thermomicrobiaceae bacterium]
MASHLGQLEARLAIRAVVFDIGGVLEYTPATGWGKRWEARLGFEPGGLTSRMAEPWHAGVHGQISEAALEQRSAEILGLGRAQLDELMADLWAEYLGTLNAELKAYFAGLRPRYRTAILSNSFVGAREREQAHYGFGDCCDLIVYSHEVGLSKPDPRVYALTCQRLGVAPEEAIFLDDVEQNVVAARACGLHAILFRDNAQAIATIEALLETEG